MRKSKLGFFVHNLDVNAGQVVRTVISAAPRAIIVYLTSDNGYVREALAGIKSASPSTMIIGRLSPADALTYKHPAGEMYSRVLPRANFYAGVVDGFMCENEPIVSSAEEMAQLAKFEVELMAHFSAGGYRYIPGSFPSGHPTTQDWWWQYEPVLSKVNDARSFVLVHEYDWPSLVGVDKWRFGRLKRFPEALLAKYPNVRFIVGEFGLDNEHQQGWQTIMDSHAYMGHLAQFDAMYGNDDRVYAGAIYTLNEYPPGAWRTFEVMPMAYEIADYIVGMGDVETTTPPPTTPRKWFWPLSTIYVTQEYKPSHLATDFRAPTGTPVYAVADGNVAAGVGEKYGVYAILTMVDGWMAVHAHLQSVVKTGKVAAGDQIAIADATGLCEPPGAAHLHFEIRDGSHARYNPTVFLSERSAQYPVPQPPVVLPPVVVEPCEERLAEMAARLAQSEQNLEDATAAYDELLGAFNNTHAALATVIGQYTTMSSAVIKFIELPRITQAIAVLTKNYAEMVEMLFGGPPRR